MFEKNTLPKGVSMMLKSLGFNPEQLQAEATQIGKGVTDLLNRIDARLLAIETQEREILKALQILAKLQTGELRLLKPQQGETGESQHGNSLSIDRTNGD